MSTDIVCKKLDGYIIEKDDLQGDIKIIAEQVGLDAALKIIQVLGGTKINIPPRKKVELKARNRKIKDEFNGANIKRLAIRHSLSETHIRNIVTSNTVDTIS